jgi:hypothetical protein
MLAAVPSSLMLGITTYITTDLSPIPLFWIVPLALYLLSFILVFARWPVAWTGQPHQVFLVVEPAAIAVLIVGLALTGDVGFVSLRIGLSVLAFFMVTMVCHGELAKDRPGTRHLTEFYLWMSVGGMVGGMFNGLVAPVLFTGQWEFPLALFAACLVRPILKEGGWFDTWFTSTFERPTSGGAPRPGPGRHHGPHHRAAAPTSQLHLTLDVALPVAVLILTVVLIYGLRSTLAGMFSIGKPADNVRAATLFCFGVPLVIACFFYGRPLRLSLAIGAVLLVQFFTERRGENVLFADRSYFGILRVVEGQSRINDVVHSFTSLRHGTTLHGENFRRPKSRDDWGVWDKDFSRLANTYYRRRGPVGVVMENYNWFRRYQWEAGGLPEEPFLKHDNSYEADLRMPTALVGMGNDPMGMMMHMYWSEPPYATIGLGTGTMAAYARPFQHMDFYEIDNHVRRLSMENLDPVTGGPFFTYVRSALDRGAWLSILMGDARLKMDEPWEQGGGPEGFYKVVVVDAFSSDAIPVHLLTVEAMRMYFRHMAEDGILCVHTSNRHLELKRVVADNTARLGFACRRGHDDEPDYKRDRNAPHPLGYSISEWIMVARKQEYLDNLRAPGGYPSVLEDRYWEPLAVTGENVWTDDYSNLLGVYRDLMGRGD